MSLFVQHTPPVTLIQGDAIDVLSQMDAESIDLIVTDPAYESLEKHRARGTTTRLKQSKSSSNQWFPIFPNERFPELFRAMFRVLKKHTHLYMHTDAETMFFVKPIAERAGFKFWKPIVWNKESIGLGYHYRGMCEFVLFFEKGKRRLNNLGIGDVLSAKRTARWVCDFCGSMQCEKKVQGESTPTGISRSPLTENPGSPTVSSGRNTTAQSHQGTRSTTKTKISKTTGSRTSNSLTQLSTGESTAAANSATVCGGNRAPDAGYSSQEPVSTTTSFQEQTTPSPGTAGPVTQSTAASDVKRCASCGHAKRKAFPTEKPVELERILVAQSSSPGELVCDPFMGSASAGEAALSLSREFFGIDISLEAHGIAKARLGGPWPKQTTTPLEATSKEHARANPET